MKKIIIKIIKKTFIILMISAMLFTAQMLSNTAKATIVEDIEDEYAISKEQSAEEIIAKLTDEMLKHAQAMEFEKAAELRDKIKELEKML